MLKEKVEIQVKSSKKEVIPCFKCNSIKEISDDVNAGIKENIDLDILLETKQISFLFQKENYENLNEEEKKILQCILPNLEVFINLKSINSAIKSENPENKVYLAGGMVRDMLLGVNNKEVDVDLSGNISPQTIQNLFGGNISEKMGTVFFQLKDLKIEYTPFRLEGDYNDRSNKHLLFDKNISGDYQHRDFTINALYFCLDTFKILDFVGGKDDIENKIIRCVGESEERFKEDYLRLLRAIRFSSKLKFDIDEKILANIENLKHNLLTLPGSRVKEELSKCVKLSGCIRKMIDLNVFQLFFPEFNEMEGLEQKSKHHKYDVLEHCLASLDFAINTYPGKNELFYLAVLLHDIGKPEQFAKLKEFAEVGDDLMEAKKNNNHSDLGVNILEKRLKKLDFSASEIDYLIFMVKMHASSILDDKTGINKKQVRKFLSLINNKPDFYLNDLVDLSTCDRFGTGTRTIDEVVEWKDNFLKIVNEVIKENNCLSLKDLVINGSDLAKLGLKGKEIGKALNLCLNAVLEDPGNNDKSYLINLVIEQNYTQPLIKF